MLYFIVNIFERGYFKTMRDSVFFCESAGVDQPLRSFLCVAQGKTKVDPRLSRRLNLCEHVIAINRHNGLAGTRFYVLAHRQSQFQKRVIDRPQMFLLAREHFINVVLRGF